MSAGALDISVAELRAARPRLRRGLRFTFQEFDGRRCAMIEDAVHSKFHRVGLPEYIFLTFLDGERTVAEACARASLSAGGEAITEGEAVTVLTWLVENEMVDLVHTPLALVAEKQGKAHANRVKELLNLLFIRIPVGSPDAFFTWAHRWFGWLCHPICGAIWLAVVVAGIGEILWSGTRFAHMAGGVLSRWDGFWMAVLFIGLKLIHEFGHGLVCKHYGCRVREAGFSLIVLFPVTYVDATSSWVLPSKWQRMHVAAGGMWLELFVAGIAAIIWSQTDEGILNSVAYRTILLASVSTLAFNMNPLMRFDGYYLFADWLEIPNLYPRATSSILQGFRKYGLGLPVGPTVGRTRKEQWVLPIYGAASLVWRVITMLVLILAAASLFKGGGLMLAVIAAALWAGPGVVQAGKTIFAGEERLPLTAWLRAGLIVTGCALLLFVPVHPRITTVALLECGVMETVRAECPGFINDTFVQPGEAVKKGQPLVQMLNLEERTELEKIQFKIRAQEAKGLREMGNKDAAAYQAEKASLDGMIRQAQEQEKRLATLNVVSPVDGVVIAWKLAQRIGTFVKPGQEVIRVGVFPANEMKIAVPEESAEAFRQQIGRPIDVLIEGRTQALTATLLRVTSRGSRDLTHPELSTVAGGPLPVVRRKEDSSHTNQKKDPYDAYQLLAPVFEATARFDGEIPPDLLPGEIAHIRFTRVEGIPLWKRAYAWVDGVVDWLVRRADHTSDQ